MEQVPIPRDMATNHSASSPKTSPKQIAEKLILIYALISVFASVKFGGGRGLLDSEEGLVR